MNHDISMNHLVKLTQEMIRTPSVSGDEEGVVSVLRRFFQNRGITDLVQDEYGSLIATMKGDKEGPVLLFDGHVDTVPVPDPQAWQYPPFEGIIQDGRLYGRGASDMKGAVAAMAVAAASFLEKTKGHFHGSLVIAGVVMEEIFEGVAARAISRRSQPDVVVIGEASELKLKIGQRGRAEIAVETLGVPAHSANPEKGYNAVYLMTEIIQAIRNQKPPTHPVLGEGILELTDIKSAPYPGASVVPSYCKATYDRRLLPGEEKEGVLAPVIEAIQGILEKDKRASAKAAYAQGRERCYTGTMIEAERFFPGWLFDESEWFIKKATKALREAGLSSDLSHYNFCTNGSHYAGEKNIPTIGFGPSCESLAHTIDEYIELKELEGAARGYLAVMESFLTS